jgi:hypothetical protein
MSWLDFGSSLSWQQLLTYLDETNTKVYRKIYSLFHHRKITSSALQGACNICKWTWRSIPKLIHLAISFRYQYGEYTIYPSRGKHGQAGWSSCTVLGSTGTNMVNTLSIRLGETWPSGVVEWHCVGLNRNQYGEYTIYPSRGKHGRAAW